LIGIIPIINETEKLLSSTFALKNSTIQLSKMLIFQIAMTTV